MIACNRSFAGRARITFMALTVSALLIAVNSRRMPGQAPPTIDFVRGRAAEWYISTPDGCRLYVLEIGTGRGTVIVVHGGFGAEHSYLLDAFQGLDSRYHLVFYDQRGSLRSACKPGAEISLQKHLDDLDRIRTTLNLQRPMIVGHSMGTFLTLSYLAQHPGSVGRIALMGSVLARSPTTAADSALSKRQDSTARTFMARPEIREQFRLVGYVPGSDQSVLPPKLETEVWRITFAAANLYHVDRWREMRGGRAFYSAEAGAAAGRTMPKSYDFVPVLSAHPCAVTVIVGDHDFIDIGAPRHKAWTAAAPNVRLVVIDKAGHNGWIDNPEQYRSALSDALSRGASC